MRSKKATRLFESIFFSIIVFFGLSSCRYFEPYYSYPETATSFVAVDAGDDAIELTVSEAVKNHDKRTITKMDFDFTVAGSSTDGSFIENDYSRKEIQCVIYPNEAKEVSFKLTLRSFKNITAVKVKSATVTEVKNWFSSYWQWWIVIGILGVIIFFCACGEPGVTIGVSIIGSLVAFFILSMINFPSFWIPGVGFIIVAVVMSIAGSIFSGA
jgi:hypothetical protein